MYVFIVGKDQGGGTSLRITFVRAMRDGLTKLGHETYFLLTTSLLNRANPLKLVRVPTCNYATYGLLFGVTTH